MTTPAIFPPIPGEKHPSWAHQLAMYWFVVELWLAGHRGAYLACDMGVGKTKVAIDLIGYLQSQSPEPVTVLYACPLRVCEVVRQQFRMHASFPYWAAILDDSVRGGTDGKLEIARDTMRRAQAMRQTAVIVVNYESAYLPPFAAWTKSRPWTLLICDELHRLKRPDGRQSRFFAEIARVSLHRLGMSGTPLAHSPLDLWAQFRILDPTIFGSSYFAFKTFYAVLGGYLQHEVKGWRNQDDLHRKFFSIAIRVEAKDVLDLPPEMDERLYCTLSPRARQIYRQLEQDLIAYLDGPEELITVANSMVLLTRLGQLVGGTLRDNDRKEHHVDDSKQRLLTDLLGDLADDEPVVAFALYRSDLDAIHRASAAAGRVSVELSGRANQLTDWQAGRASVLAAQIQAAGEGLDFTRARYAAFFSTGFSLKNFTQARKRLHRPGQQRAVCYYHLLATDTIDLYVADAIERRADLVESTLKGVRDHALRHHPHR